MRDEIFPGRVREISESIVKIFSYVDTRARKKKRNARSSGYGNLSGPREEERFQSPEIKRKRAKNCTSGILEVFSGIPARREVNYNAEEVRPRAR